MKPGHVASYLALAVEAELYRQQQWPREERGSAPEDSPTYGTECQATNSRLDTLAGVKHSTQRNRYLDELVGYGHIEVAVRGSRRGPGRYRLLTKVEAEAAWRRFLEEEEARWWRPFEAGELPFQIDGTRST